MTLTPAWLDELRARTTLSTLIGRTVKLQKAGREYRACCPFHQEKSPSFYVNDDKGFYHCFGCSAHGDAIKFLTEARGLPFMDAVKELAATAGLEVPAADPRSAERQARALDLHDVMAAAERWFGEQLAGPPGADARAYCERRGVSPAQMRGFGFGFAPDGRTHLRTALAAFGDAMLVEAGLLIQVDDKPPYDRFRGRLMIPIRDQRGRTIAFGGRILGPGEPKYLNSPETPLFDKGRTLFNLDRAAVAARKAGRVVVVEGYMDVVALDRAGIAEAVAPLGTALTEAQLERLWRMAEVPILCFDGDAAGQKAAIRAAMRALPLVQPGRTLSFAQLPTGLDPDDIVEQQGAAGFEKVLQRLQPMDEMIWQAEISSANLGSPEGRAGLGQKLREHARSIADQDVKTQYLALFRQRLTDLFTPDNGTSGRVTESGKWLNKRRSAPPELLAISAFGMTKAVFAPAALKGLRRHPEVIASHAEIVGHLGILLLHRSLRQLCQEMLDASFTNDPLEPEALDAILRNAGLAETLSRLDQKKVARFTFLVNGADEREAKRDLKAVLEILAATPEVQAAVEEATARLQRDHDEAAFREQVRVQIVRERLVGELADLLQRQVEAAV